MAGNDFGAAHRIVFEQDAPPVACDGVLTDAEVRSNLLIGISFGGQF